MRDPESQDLLGTASVVGSQRSSTERVSLPGGTGDRACLVSLLSLTSIGAEDILYVLAGIMSLASLAGTAAYLVFGWFIATLMVKTWESCTSDEVILSC